MKQWIITVENPQKVGLYYFAGFYAGKAHWECSWCNTGKTKVYKTKSTVNKNVKKLKPLFPNCIIKVTEIGEGTTGAELHIYWPDQCTVEERYFSSFEEAEKYASDNGLESKDYDIYPMALAV